MIEILAPLLFLESSPMRSILSSRILTISIDRTIDGQRSMMGRHARRACRAQLDPQSLPGISNHPVNNGAGVRERASQSLSQSVRKGGGTRGGIEADGRTDGLTGKGEG